MPRLNIKLVCLHHCFFSIGRNSQVFGKNGELEKSQAYTGISKGLPSSSQNVLRQKGDSVIGK